MLRSIVACLLTLFASPLPAQEAPPPPREFRAVWVATVANIDWPSRPGLPVERQKAEAVAILDQAKTMNLNAVILQVRPATDALYASELEPWSYYLTGEQGRAPEPAYDPLTFWVEEAHRRGLQLHAWFNPFRARQKGAPETLAPNHVSKSHPDWIKSYGGMLWMDPGVPEARRHTLDVILDVVRRYDVDGIHFDDYFYPYPVADPDHKGQQLDFPDDPAWQAYRKSGGELERADWRRENINALVQELYESIKAEKPHVQFGISPFGLPGPGRPAGIVGFNQYDQLYADAEKWLREGWCDYFTPQLYWNIASKGQPFEPLLRFWVGENARGRHIWPGTSVSRVGSEGYPPEEFSNQVKVVRQTEGADGIVLFSDRPLMANKEGIATHLSQTVFREPALVSPSPWLDHEAPGRPRIEQAIGSGRGHQIEVFPGSGEPPFLWAVRRKAEGGWTFDVFPATKETLVLAIEGETVVWAVDRLGNASEPATVGRGADRP
jgi:uncharacterized lipoprotein YddW (UPF0748 family)